MKVEIVKKKAPKLSKSEQIVARKNEALKILKQMQKVDKQQERVINAWDSAGQKNKQSGRRKVNDNFYAKLNKQLEKEEEMLYDKYYKHIYKDFNPNKSRVNFCDRKYKNGFVDEMYVNDLYNSKLEKLSAKRANKR